MIYLVSEQHDLFETDRYSKLSVNDALEFLREQPELGGDTETQGMSPFTKKLLTVQLGTEETQIVWDCTTVNVQHLKPILEHPEIKTIWWNYSFDGKFLYHNRIVPINVYDGMLAEQLLWLGYPKGMHSMSLASAGKYYCNVDIDKSIRGQIITKGLTPDVVQYAGYDVKWEIPIYKAQLKELERADLLKAIQLENEFVKVMAYIEYCGVKLDVPRWKAKMERDLENQIKWESSLNSWVEHKAKEDYDFQKKYTYTDLQGDLFDGFNTDPKCILNWKSPKQLIPFFEELGFNLETFDKKTKEKKKSVAGDIIKGQRDKCPELADAYCNFKDASKVVDSFGQNFLDAIDKGDGRIHASFFQIGTDTGRLSSGGGEAGVNMQQLPHDAETRACFIGEPGNKWISADYQGQESCIIASTANDTAMIDLLQSKGDIHSLVAKMSYPDIIGDTPVDEVKSKFKFYRQEAKGIEFAINYGGDANTIANNKGIPKREAEKIYNNFMKGFPGVKRYQDFARAEVMKTGYILMNPITRHKAFIYDWAELKEIQENMNDPLYMAIYEQYKNSKVKNEVVDAVKHYIKRKSASEKQSINYRIQNRGAMAFKLASIKLFNYLRSKNLLFIVKYCVPAHDEINLECPADIADEIADILVKCMESGGKPFCPRVHLGADVSIDDHWVH